MKTSSETSPQCCINPPSLSSRFFHVHLSALQLTGGREAAIHWNVYCTSVCLHVHDCVHVQQSWKDCRGKCMWLCTKKARLESIHRALQDRKDLSPITRNLQSLFYFFLMHRCVLFAAEFIYQRHERNTSRWEKWITIHLLPQHVWLIKAQQWLSNQLCVSVNMQQNDASITH